MYSYRAGGARRVSRTKPVPYVEPHVNPDAHRSEPRSSIPLVSTYREFPGNRRASWEAINYTVVGGDTWSPRWSSSKNSMSPLPTQSQTPGVRSENSNASEFPRGVSEKETVVQPPRNLKQSIPSQFRSFTAASGRKPAIKSSSILLDQNSRGREIQARMSHSINDDEDWQQIEAGDRTSSASDGVFRCTTSPWRMRVPRATASLSFDFDPSNWGFSDTDNPPLVYRDLDSFSGPAETDRAIGNQNPVDDGEFFASASPMSRETDTTSSGEESFVFNSQSPPSFDGGSQQELEALVSEIAQELVREFVSASGGMNVHTPQSSQESPTSSSNGTRPSTGSSSSTAEMVGSSGKNKRRAHDGNEKPRRPQKPRTESPIPDDLDSECLLACPYTKFDPNRYSEMNQNLHEKAYRRCRSVCLTNIPRLKQHLYRIHRRPEYFCSSCYTEFKSESDCEVHARARPACLLKECPFQEKMTHEQYKAVKRRKMRRDATSVWYGIFDILFPSAQRPGTPYVDDATSPATREFIRDYNTYLETNLPQRLSERMGGPLFGGDPMMFQWLVNMALEETLPTVLQELHDTYQMLRSVEGTNDVQVGQTGHQSVD